MKIKSLVAALTVLGMWALAVQAHGQVMQVININVTATHQNEGHDDGTVTTITSGRETRNTADLLEVLARDEFAAGNYANTNFPAGSKLVVSNGVFMVVDKTNSPLVVVSNILSFVLPTANDVHYGKRNDNTGLGSPSFTDLYVGKFIFDDTAIAGGQDLMFYIQGLVKDTQTDSVNTKNQTYTETHSAQLTNGVGDGTSDGEPFVVTGTLTASGKGTFPLPPL